jgi:hypothetical protein
MLFTILKHPYIWSTLLKKIQFQLITDGHKTSDILSGINSAVGMIFLGPLDCREWWHFLLLMGLEPLT